MLLDIISVMAKNESSSYILESKKAQEGEKVSLELRLKTTTVANSFAVGKITVNGLALDFVGFSDINPQIKDEFIFNSFDDEKATLVLGTTTSKAYDIKICNIDFKVKTGAAKGDYAVCADTIIKNDSDVLESLEQTVLATISIPDLSNNGDGTTPPQGGKNDGAEQNISASERPIEDDKATITDEKTISFVDVKSDDWFSGSVNKAYELGLMNGITEDSFAPHSAVTRGMFVTVLHRMSGEPIVNYAMMFEDVNLDEYYSEAVRWAASEKIVNGMSDVLFAPNDKITREQMATMLHRYAKAIGKDVSVGENTNILSFKDSHQLSEYATEAIAWTCGSGVMNGNADGTFAPRNSATRAELATVLVRAAEMLK